MCWRNMGALVEELSAIEAAIEPQDRATLVLTAIAGSETGVRRIVTAVAERSGTPGTYAAGNAIVWGTAGTSLPGNPALRALVLP